MSGGPKARRLGWGAAVGGLLLGCALGVRGQGAFEAEHDLQGVRTVIVDVPATPLRVQGCDDTLPESCPPRLEYSGVWSSVGASGREAERNARAASLLFETDADAGLARLTADVPLEVDGLVELELERLALPGQIDLDLRTERGDVEVRGMQGVVTVEVGAGDVEVFGAPVAVAASTEGGFVHARTSGSVDLRARGGEVLVEQTGGAQDVVVEAGGDVVLYLASDESVRFDLHAGGDIRVATPNVVALTRGAFRREVGEGEVLVQAHAEGDVVVELYDPGS